MMIHAYSEFYLNDAKQNLAEFFDYAVNACHFEANLFSKLFVQSGMRINLNVVILLLFQECRE